MASLLNCAHFYMRRISIYTSGPKSSFPVHTSITKSLSSESVSATMVLRLDYFARMSGLFSLSESVSILNRFILMAALSTGERETETERERERESHTSLTHTPR